MPSMRSVLLDPATRPGHVFIYRGCDLSSCKHPYTDEPQVDPWADRFPPGRSAVEALECSPTGRVRFRMINLDNDDSDIWAGLANAARCLIEKGD